MTRRFDIVRALRRIVLAFWLDFAPIVLLGFGMLTLPELLSAMVAPSSAGATILAVLSGLLAALFITIVSHGVVERLRGRALAAGTFVSRGIVASPPGLSVALLLGASIVVVAIVALLATRMAGYASFAVLGASLVATMLVLPAIPAATTERLGALPALRRALALTNGSRARIGLIVGVGVLAYLTLATLLSLLPGEVDGWTLASPGLWLRALCDLLAAGLAAVVPGVVYVGLTETRLRG